MNDRVTTYHEAAHAVVAYRVAGHVGGPVSIVPRPDRGTLGFAADGESDSFSADDMEATILSCYAAGYAPRLIDPQCGDDGCDQDDADADEQLRLFGWESREEELRDRSLNLVRDHWNEIEAVADELLRVRVLYAEEVEILADAAAGDPEADLALHRQVRPDLEFWRAQIVNGQDDFD
jgi:hypothetical protein